MTPKMEPTWRENKWRQLPRGHPKRFENSDSFVSGFGVPLDAFWHPFRRLLDILGAFWLPSGACWPPSGCLFGSLWKFFGPPRTCRDFDENFRELAEISPRTCRSSAENLPSFRRESAKNQPRTCRMNPRQNCLSRCAFFELNAFSDKRFNKIAGNKSGAAVSPLGGLRLNNPRKEKQGNAWEKTAKI